MNRVLAIVAVLSLFVAGIAIGALGMRIYDDRQVRHFDDSPGPGGGFVGRHLHRMLDLSAEQMQKIDAILQHSHEQAMELRDDLHPRVTAIMDRAHEEIAGILNPEQRERFRQLLQDNRRRAERWFLGPPDGGRSRGRGGSWGGPGRRPWGPPSRDGSPPGGPPSRWPDDATPDQPSEPPSDPQDAPEGG
jgi:Spy/CpxP family protein refolding chaperone